MSFRTVRIGRSVTADASAGEYVAEALIDLFYPQGGRLLEGYEKSCGHGKNHLATLREPPIYPNKLPTVLTVQSEPNGVFGFRRLPNKPLPLVCKAGTRSHPKKFRCHGIVIQAVMFATNREQKLKREGESDLSRFVETC
jgi:hypothetical protein